VKITNHVVDSILRVTFSLCYNQREFLIHAVFECPVPPSVKVVITISIFDSIDHKLRHPILQREPLRRLRKRPSAIRSGMTLRMTGMTLPHTTKISKTSKIRGSGSIRCGPAQCAVHPPIERYVPPLLILSTSKISGLPLGRMDLVNFFLITPPRPHHVICHFQRILFEKQKKLFDLS
jgi:hypothetical protein